MKRKRKQSGGPTRDEDFEAFCRALPALLKTDPALFVAFSGGRLVDKDPDEFALVERVAREHPGQRVRIQQVIETGMMDVYLDTSQAIDNAQLEKRIREALAEPEEPVTLEQFKTKMQEIVTKAPGPVSGTNIRVHQELRNHPCPNPNSLSCDPRHAKNPNCHPHSENRHGASRSW